MNQQRLGDHAEHAVAVCRTRCVEHVMGGRTDHSGETVLELVRDYRSAIADKRKKA